MRHRAHHQNRCDQKKNIRSMRKDPCASARSFLCPHDEIQEGEKHERQSESCESHGVIVGSFDTSCRDDHLEYGKCNARYRKKLKRQAERFHLRAGRECNGRGHRQRTQVKNLSKGSRYSLFNFAHGW